MIKVLFVCHGNICRSTMAESLFTHMIAQRDLSTKFEIASAGTSSEEIGNPVHHSTQTQLKQNGVAVVPHRAVQMKKSDIDYYDYIIAMDTANIRNIERIAGHKSEKVAKLLSFAGSSDDVADPWYTGDFETTFKDIKIGLEGFLSALKF
ncbi:low molecular weight protein-tyrosine-phosphatase [Campylobacter sp. RM16192]|uniref:low molecular weight protein-tyrosine-phosphatase n=1 Tax=Campylobacter sp. RM16192 TaxID=1660080 RepID=UPI00145155BF|nr:low molecular weight protein-tyrosine-phosphatase [Campylobacter sp. RM16192]QCD52196.1 low molecular weight protein-tyrosine-phosphatase [Campylobacter sp. RM16192]